MSQTVKFFSCTATRDLAAEIAACYGSHLGEVSMLHFSDGEFQPSFEETVRGSDVYIIQSTTPPADNLLELLLLVDAAKRASARHVIAVMPYFGYARQDRKDKPRVSIGAKLIANLLSAAGVTRVVTMDLHADQIQGFFEVPVDHMYASSIFIPYIESLTLPNLIFATPDAGGTKRANIYAKYFNTDFVIGSKLRKRANEVDSITIIGDVKGKDVILVDDMIDTAGTLTTAANQIIEEGAASVRAICTHPILSGKAYDRISDSALTELIVCNTIPLKQNHPKIKALSVANLFAEVIQKIQNFESISPHFIC
ncbi:MAG: ribose-phosphate pyrophosphokinase [Flavobacteriales bacterium]|nr:ribose-phosphate pyrophosphokinase [Flavobacteriales bacterium]MCB9446713.1 ribose-phosphate pyrophosphokinase [Flavobacteriales bacterium]